MKFREYLEKARFVLFDGAFGTEILKAGIDISNFAPEYLNLKNPEIVKKIHKSYLEAGSDVITTNTFGANRLKLQNYQLEDKIDEIILAGVEIAKSAIDDFPDRNAFVAASVGPVGKLLEPLGDLKFDELEKVYDEVFTSISKTSVDLIILETMLDINEAKLALISAKKNTNLPAIVSLTFENGERLTTGTPPEACAILFSEMGADAVGANCSTGPRELQNVLSRMQNVTSAFPLIIQANAGLPISENGKTIFPLKAQDFANEMCQIAKNRAKILGGCCGTSPEHIGELKKALQNLDISSQKFETEKSKRDLSKISFFTSRTKVLELQKYPIILGERINTNAQKKIAESIKTQNFSAIMSEAISQVEKGAELLDVNICVPNIDEPKIMSNVIKDISGVVNVPICIDSPDFRAIETGLKYFPGKALVNSVDGEEEKLNKILPIVKKYGASIVALTMDEDGIPLTVEKRFEIAKKIVNECEKHGIERKNIFIDALVLSISTNPEGAKTTLETIRRIKNDLGTRTILGLSNISFGLPGRSVVNASFLAMAIEAGLDIAITNPMNESLRNTFYAACLLSGQDFGAEKYINSFYEEEIKSERKKESEIYSLGEAIIRGLKDKAVELVKRELDSKTELEIINELIIPSLDIVGEKYEKGIYFLPQLLLAAETAESVSRVLQENIRKKGEVISENDKKIVFATVKGDLHDIGKNIVISVLKNYNYDVIDLGKSVDVETIIKTAIDSNAKAICLSALMTTTMPEMQKIVDELTKRNLRDRFKVIVGGAVVNEDFAISIKADAYSKDATSLVALLRKFGI